MKVVILAGGLGTRFSEETYMRPKPMIEIGGKPILWHVMKIYASYGFHEFIICCGYKGYLIKEYFMNYFQHMSDMTIDLKDNSVEIHEKYAEPWKITLVDTGEKTMTGGRLKRVEHFIKNDEAFCFTYGDGVGNINISKLIIFHKNSGLKATLTSVHPPGRFGALNIKDNRVVKFREKPRGDGAFVNGGFFVLSPEVLEYIEGDNTIWESGPLERLANEGQLGAYVHQGFWQPMDTMRDKISLETHWETGIAPWKVW